jgi:hypothetical protein
LFRLDPWFLQRFLFRDLCHPRSQLSSTILVHRAFFSDSYPVEEVRKFESLMPEYEGIVWPLGMMFRFVDVRKVLESIVGWKDDKNWRILVIAGEKDRLNSVSLMERMAAMYRAALETCWSGKGDARRDVRRRDGQDGVGFSVIKGSEHHVQNDLHWEECAEQALAFVNQL